MQDALTNLGFGTGGIDGIFGAGTENAVYAYQRSKGIMADGIVGCQTWSNLMYNVIPKTATLEPAD